MRPEDEEVQADRRKKLYATTQSKLIKKTYTYFTARNILNQEDILKL